MGGLDAVAAIIDEDEPLGGLKNLVTVATPHRGSEWGDTCEIHAIQDLRKLKPYQIPQGVNLDPDHQEIQKINRIENRQKLVDNLNKLYCLGGTKDMAVFSSSKFNIDGLTEAEKSKIETLEQYGGATHSGRNGITQDPRALRDIIRILADIPLAKQRKNFGFVN
jgi:triacylglycerol esterase/lipase EstA (alpha/beta hydrolase family)